MMRMARGWRCRRGPRRITLAAVTFERLLPAAKLLVALIVGVATLLPALPARSEPYMAIRNGRKCSSCHVNMDGGGMRTLLANTHMQDITHYLQLFEEFEKASEVFNGQITSFLSVGADLRVDDSIVFQDEPDEQGLVPHKAFRGDVDENILGIRRAPVYLMVEPVPEYLAFYVDQLLAPDLVTREAFGLLRGVLPWRGYAKAGRFFLDYGLRAENDNLFSIDASSQNVFVRGRTGTDFSAFYEGAEIGFEPGPMHASLSITDAPGDTDVRVTTNVYAMLRDLPVVENAIFGASFMYFSPPEGDRFVYGAYAGSNLGPLEYQAEIDFVHQERQDDGALGTFLVYGELNYLILPWLNAKAFGEYADNAGATDTPESAQNRFGLGIEPFIGRFLQTRLFYSVANGPKDVAVTNQNRLIFEVHLFF